MSHFNPRDVWNWDWPKYPKASFFRDAIIVALLIYILYLRSLL